MNQIRVKTDIVYNKVVKNDLTIIHIADIHLNETTKVAKLNKIKDTIIKNNPDYVVITGDLIDNYKIISNKKKIKELLDFLTAISHTTKLLISLGNHDILLNDDLKFFKKINEIKNIFVLDNDIYSDKSILISGMTLPNNYYYNVFRSESKEVLINYLKENKKLTENLTKDVPKICLVHSPINIPNKEVLTYLKEYDLILSGHTHAGLVPRLLSKVFKPNQGLISPYKKLFPNVARGKIVTKKNSKDITLIINGGITKLSCHSAKFLNNFNFLYDTDINKIIITNKKGINK